MKNIYGLLCALFIGITQAQQPPATLALETPAGFYFNRPISSLQVIAAAQAAEELREAREVVAKKSPEQLPAAQAVLDAAEKKLASWRDGELFLLNFMGRCKTPEDRMHAAIRENNWELLKFALARKEPVDEQVFYDVAKKAIGPCKKPADSDAKLTLVEELLIRAHNIPQDKRDGLLDWADIWHGKFDLIPLLRYGGVITVGNKQYSVEGGARGQFVDQWAAGSLHKIIATGDVEGKSAADLVSLQHKILDLCKRNKWWKDIEEDTLKAVRKALDAGADVNQSDSVGRSLLHVAAQYSTPAIVELLLDRGAKIDAKDAYKEMPLHYAARYGQTEIVGVLCRDGAPIDAKDNYGETPLHMASEYGHLETVGVLLDCGAPIGAGGRWGQTPLHSAAKQDQPETVRLLLDSGAPIEATNYYGLTPLHCAAETGQKEIVCLLVLEGKADIDARDPQGMAPLHRAVIWGKIDTVGVLLTLGAPIDVQDNDGLTPLHYAAEKGRMETVRLLLEKGANPFIRDDKGKNALDYSHSEEIRMLLEDAMKEYKTANKLCIFL